MRIDFINICSLAMAEISTLVAAIYLKYRTSLVGNTNYSPGINSRFELFFDTRFPNVKARFPLVNANFVA